MPTDRPTAPSVLEAEPPAASRRLGVVLSLVVVALVSAFLTWTLPRSSTVPVQPIALTHAQMVTAPRTAAQQAFHDQMRKLWEDHVTWTRLAIVTFADSSAGFQATATRLLQNQTDIGNAVVPFYGAAAGSRLSALLHDHITIAVELLQAAKANDTAAFADAKTRWYSNANDIADFLAAANPRFWPDSVMRDDMKVHLDQTLAEASDELTGNYPGSVTDYEAIHAHILQMADMLSDGIIGAFPTMFH